MSTQSNPDFTTDFKTKVVLEALKEQFSTEQLADKYQVDATEINNWKSDFLSKAYEAFKKKKREIEVRITNGRKITAWVKQSRKRRFSASSWDPSIESWKGYSQIFGDFFG